MKDRTWHFVISISNCLQSALCSWRASHHTLLASSTVWIEVLAIARAPRITACYCYCLGKREQTNCLSQNGYIFFKAIDKLKNQFFYFTHSIFDPDPASPIKINKFKLFTALLNTPGSARISHSYRGIQAYLHSKKRWKFFEFTIKKMKNCKEELKQTYLPR